MSINVTVTGNPVSIKRGKMVTADLDYAKKEFQRRRRMRLEQVRQQSKDIAEDVRNKVRKEKTKQLSEIEHEGASKLKEWQSRKLLELQQQYCESLKDIGLGHTAAGVEETREDLANAYKDVLREKSKERGYVAAKQLHDEKGDNASAKTLKSQQRKDVRNLENARSVMVSKLKASPFKKKKPKKPTTNINITSVIDDSESGGVSAEEEEESSDIYASRGATTATSLSKADSPKQTRIRQTKKSKRKSSPEITRSPPGSPEPEHRKMPLENPEIDFPLDTRISDRIKRRLNIPLSQPISRCYLQENSVTKNGPMIDEIPTQTKLHQAEPRIPKADFRCPSYNHEVGRTKEDIIRKSDIPEKPKVMLKSSSKTSNMGGDFSKVQYYDHANRFSKEYLCDNSCVQKIQDDSVDICPSTSSEREFMEKVYKRDRDALDRGKKAMEKEKIHRDYNELMQQLPVLQRRERIASISASNNPVFHMSDERLKSYELRRQNKMEEVYEKFFPVVTIPPKRHDVQTEPFRTVDVEPTRNLATWDVDFTNRDVIVMKDDGVITVEAEASEDRAGYLKNMLEKLRTQKEMLMREVGSLPSDSDLRNLIEGMGGIEVQQWRNEYDAKKKVVPNTVENEECYCPETGPCHSKSSKDGKRPTKSHHLRSKHKILQSSSSSSPSPRKKAKYKKQTLVLQNTSTQTTPKRSPPRPDKSLEAKIVQRKDTDVKHFEIQTEENDRKEKPPTRKIASSQTDFISTATEKDKPPPSLKTVPEKDKKPKVKETTHTRSPKHKGSASTEPPARPPCDCTDDVYEILIKIKDDEPEIVIKSPKKAQKPLLVKADVQKHVKKKPSTKKQLQFQTSDIPDAPAKAATSWKEYFSKNNSLGTSTSTSYNSPPDFQSSTRNNLHEQLDPRLLTYIKKLLTMSRASVDDLGVSSVSEISTPSSVVGKSDPLNQLRNIVRYFNLNPHQLAECLNYSNETDGTTSTISRQSCRENRSSSTEQSTSLKSESEAHKYKVISARIENIVEQTARNIEGNSTSSYTDPNALSQYSKIAEMCHQRISNLSEMIEKVRQDKQRMLSPNLSDKENSTAYMNLPSQLGGATARPNSPNMSVSSSSEPEQIELTRKLLEVDYSSAQTEVLKKQKDEPQATSSELHTISDIDADLVARYRALLNDDDIPNKDDVPFVPLLLDIPRLPKLTLSSSTKTDSSESADQTKAAIQNAFTQLNHSEKKPPPSKGLYAAKKFNNNITTVPHELSTIVEVDSQLSTKARQSTSPVIFETIKPLVVPPNPENSIWTSQATLAKPLSDESLPDILAELLQQPPSSNSDSKSKNAKRTDTRKQLNMYQISQVIAEQSTDSSTDKSELENVEAMLKSMGMGWAVATIKKTQEALTRASSSSSLESTTKKHKSNSSDVSLRQFLDNKIFSGSSETGSKTTDSTLSPFLRELQEISGIQGSGASSETKNQRTSTPVQTTKSSDKSKNESQKGLFAVESDLSSVKSKTEDMFVTIPSDISTSTGDSQSKSSDL